MAIAEISKEEYLRTSEKSQTLRVINGRYHIKNICLGYGSFGKVYACWDSKEKNVCAIKEISKA